jgi:hypothetical protein
MVQRDGSRTAAAASDHRLKPRDAKVPAFFCPKRDAGGGQSLPVATHCLVFTCAKQLPQAVRESGGANPIKATLWTAKHRLPAGTVKRE